MSLLLLFGEAPVTNVSVGHASGTGSASGATTALAPTAGNASGTGAATTAAVSLAATAAHASGTGAAADATTSVAPVIAAATGTGAALDIDPNPAIAVAVGHASGTGAAAGHQEADLTLLVPAHATGTGAAYNIAVTVAPSVLPAEGVGSLQTEYTADPANGYSVRSTSAVYATARTGGTLLAQDEASEIVVGQQELGGTYSVFEGFVSFDTSALGAAVVTEATLSTYEMAGNTATTPYELQARTRDYGSTVDSGDWVSGASLSALPLVATLDSSAVEAGGRYEWTGTIDVDTDGPTRLLLHSDQQVAGVAPQSGANDFGQFANAVDGFAPELHPLLTVTYTYHTSADVKVGVGIATGTGTAHDVTAVPGTIVTGTGVATGTGAAHDITVVTSPFVEVTVGHASGTGAAFDVAPTIQSVQNVNVPVATGTGDVPILAVSVAATVEAATGTGEAFTPDTSTDVDVPSQNAEGTGAAYDVLVIVAVNPALASGTGAAFTLSADVALGVGHASGTGSVTSATVSTDAGGLGPGPVAGFARRVQPAAGIAEYVIPAKPRN